MDDSKEINRTKSELALSILCPVKTCQALPGKPCEMLAWAESEALHHGVFHTLRYSYAKRSKEAREDHDPGDECAAEE